MLGATLTWKLINIIDTKSNGDISTKGIWCLQRKPWIIMEYYVWWWLLRSQENARMSKELIKLEKRAMEIKSAIAKK